MCGGVSDGDDVVIVVLLFFGPDFFCAFCELGQSALLFRLSMPLCADMYMLIFVRRLLFYIQSNHFFTRKVAFVANPCPFPGELEFFLGGTGGTYGLLPYSGESCTRPIHPVRDFRRISVPAGIVTIARVLST